MKSSNTLAILGATLTILGSFLPWEVGGGFLGLVTHGLRVDIANFKYWLTGIHEFPVYDYGGVLVILLTSFVIVVLFQPPKFIRNPQLWNLIISAGLMVSSLFFVGRGLIHVYNSGNSIEQPTVKIGLIYVVLGSALLLWRAIMTYHSNAYRQPKHAG
jgi:hypothetical protein